MIYKNIIYIYIRREHVLIPSLAKWALLFPAHAVFAYLRVFNYTGKIIIIICNRVCSVCSGGWRIYAMRKEKKRLGWSIKFPQPINIPFDK